MSLKFLRSLPSLESKCLWTTWPSSLTSTSFIFLMIEISCLSSSVAYFYFFYTLMGSLNLVVVNLADLADLLTALMF